MIKDKDEYLEKTTTAFEVIIEDLKNNIENLNENIENKNKTASNIKKNHAAKVK